MSSNDLMMRLQLQLQDKVLAPLKRLQQGSNATAKALQLTRTRLRELEKQNGLVQKLRREHEAFRRMNTEMRSSQSNLIALKQSGSATSAQIRAQTALVKKNAAAFENQKNKLVALRAQAANSGIKNLTNDERRLASEIRKTTEQLRQQESTLRRMNDLRSRRDAALTTAAKIGGTGLGMRMLGQRGLSAAASFVMPGFEFDMEMARVQALSQLDKNSETFQALRQQARDLGASTNFSANDAAQGQAFLAMAGFTPEAIMAAMPGLLDLSLAGGIELGRASDIASNISSGFGIDPKEMSRVADVLTATFTNANLDMEMLGETMKYMAPIASAAGVSLEKSAAMAGILGNVGIQGSSAGTQLRTMLTRLSTKGAEVLDDLGIKAIDADGNLRDVVELFFELDKATQNMGSAERLAVLNEVFDQRAMAGASELMKQIADGKLQEFSTMLENSEGTAKRVASIMNEHLGGKLKELESGWEEFGNQFYDSISGALSDAVVWLTEFIAELNKWAAANPELVKSIAYVVGIVLALMTAIGSVMIVIAALLAPLAIFKFTLGVIGIKGLGVLSFFSKAAWLLKALYAVMIANPIGALITAFILLALAIYKNWDSIVWFFEDIWDQLQTAFDGGIAGISAFIINWSPIGLFYKAFAKVMDYFGITLPEHFTGFGAMIMEGLVNGIKNGLGWVKDSIMNVGDSVLGWFKEKLNINSPSRVFAAAAMSIPEGAALGITRGLPKVRRATQDMADEATDEFGSSMGVAYRPLTRTSSASGTTIGGDTIYITISANTASNPQDIAAALNAELEKRDQAKRARARSSYNDD